MALRLQSVRLVAAVAELGSFGKMTNPLVNVAAIALMILGGIFAALNWACMLTSLFTKKHSSMVPPLGGLLLVVGFALHPSLRPYALCGLLLDIGFWAMLVATPMLLREALRSAPWHRVTRVSGQWSDVTFHLSLYRPDYYVVRLSRSLPPGATGWIARFSCGRWVEIAEGLSLISHTDSEVSPSRAVLTGQLRTGHFTVTASSFSPADREPEFPPAGTLIQTAA